MKVLIVDAVENIKILIELLKNDYQIFFATNGLKGLELAADKKPDLVLLDIIMEPINGYEVCRRLKADQKTKDFQYCQLVLQGSTLLKKNIVVTLKLAMHVQK